MHIKPLLLLFILKDIKAYCELFINYSETNRKDVLLWK